MSLSIHPESDPVPIHIVGIGTNHFKLNTQGAERYVAEIEQALTGVPGKKIIYNETFGPSEEESSRVRRLVRNQGFLFYTASQFVNSTDQNKVAARLKQLQRPDNELFTDPQILHPDNFFTFFILRGLERLRVGQKPNPGLDFDYVLEAHTPTLLKRLNTQNDNLNKALRVGIDQWNSGQFDKGMDADKAWAAGKLKFQEAREPEMHTQLRTLVNNIQGDPDGGVLVVVAGYTHGGLIQRLREFDFRPNVSPFFEELIAVPANTPDLVIDQKLRAGQTPDDVLFAQDMFLKRGLDYLAKEARKGKLSTLCQNYETVTTAVIDIATTLSLADIRRYCEQQQSFSTFIRKFPSGIDILSLME